MPIVTSTGPVEISPEQAQAAQQPGVTPKGTVGADMIDPGTGTSDEEAWDTESDGADGTLGWYDYSAKHCWFWTLAVQWSVWPLQGRISQDTTWCSMYYRYMSYRSTHLRLGSTLCGKGNAQVYKIMGGIGDWYTDVRGAGTFWCPIKYVSPQFDEWVDGRYTAGGGADYLRWS